MKNFNKKGFTLIEMLIVVVIIGILAAALIPRLTGVKDKADDSARKADLQQLVTAMASYSMDKGLTTIVGNSTTTPGVIAALTGGAMSSIPTDPQNISNPTLFGITTTGFAFFIGSKGGVASGTFMFVSRAETAGAANFVECSANDISGGMNMDTFIPCTSVTMGTPHSCSSIGAACVAATVSELRIVQKY